MNIDSEPLDDKDEFVDVCSDCEFEICECPDLCDNCGEDVDDCNGDCWDEDESEEEVEEEKT